MKIECPSCGSRYVQLAKPKSLRQKWARLVDFHVAVCRDCKRSFLWHALALADLIFAKCPQCFRTDLGMWEEKYYFPSFQTRLLLRLGAKRWRCEACRQNFASFLPRKSPYKRSKSTAGEYRKAS